MAVKTRESGLKVNETEIWVPLRITLLKRTNPNNLDDWLAWLRLGKLTRHFDVFMGSDDRSDGQDCPVMGNPRGVTDCRGFVSESD